MAETLTIRSERVEHTALLVAQFDRMGVQPLLDAQFPTHGNWVGLSLGWVTVLWLIHILCEAADRLEPRATLGPAASPDPARRATGQQVHPLDLSLTTGWRPCWRP